MISYRPLLLVLISTCLAREHYIVARNTIAIIPSTSPTRAATPSATPDQRQHSKHVNDFYKLYGWLKPNTSVPDSELPKAIRKIQKVLKEPVTGVFSDEMMDIVTRPRCGTEQPYDETDANSPVGLHKRYVLWGSKWAKTTLTWRIRSYSNDLSANLQQSTIKYVRHPRTSSSSSQPQHRIHLLDNIRTPHLPPRLVHHQTRHQHFLQALWPRRHALRIHINGFRRRVALLE
jgi:hypothetical protein